MNVTSTDNEDKRSSRRTVNLIASFKQYGISKNENSISMFDFWTLHVTNAYYQTLLNNKFETAIEKNTGAQFVLSRDTIATDWVFVVRSCFFEALDIKYTTRTINKKSTQALTQGPGFSFNIGDTLHCSSRNRDLIVQVISKHKSEHKSLLRIQFFISNEMFSMYTPKDDFHCSENQFVNLLSLGKFIASPSGKEISIYDIFPSVEKCKTSGISENKILRKRDLNER